VLAAYSGAVAGDGVPTCDANHLGRVVLQSPVPSSRNVPPSFFPHRESGGGDQQIGRGSVRPHLCWLHGVWAAFTPRVTRTARFTKPIQPSLTLQENTSTNLVVHDPRRYGHAAVSLRPFEAERGRAPPPFYTPLLHEKWWAPVPGKSTGDTQTTTLARSSERPSCSINRNVAAAGPTDAVIAACDVRACRPGSARTPQLNPSTLTRSTGLAFNRANPVTASSNNDIVYRSSADRRSPQRPWVGIWPMAISGGRQLTSQSQLGSQDDHNKSTARSRKAHTPHPRGNVVTVFSERPPSRELVVRTLSSEGGGN